MGYVGCRGKPVYFDGDMDALPSARELHFNIIKLSERVAYGLLGYKRVQEKNHYEYVKDPKKKNRVSVDGTLVLIDGIPVYDRLTGGKGIS